jgi:hypothetical protein
MISMISRMIGFSVCSMILPVEATDASSIFFQLFMLATISACKAFVDMVPSCLRDFG